MGTYDGTELGSTDGTDVFFLGDSLGYLYGQEVGLTDGT